MRPRIPLVLVLALAALASACLENTAPGNDREAALDAAAPPAEVVMVGAALEGVATEMLYPQIMTDQDIRNVPSGDETCVFRFTRVGFPVFVYGATRGVIKLNGKLVPLPGVGDGAWEDGAVRVTVRPLDEGEADGPVPAELVLRFQGAPNELGYHGVSDC